MPHDSKKKEANIVAAAVHIAGGPQRVAKLLGVSRSQIYRWIAAGSMSHAIYLHVSALAKLSGIRPQYLCGEILGDAEISGIQSDRSFNVAKPKRDTEKADEILLKPQSASSAPSPARLSQTALGKTSIFQKKSGFAPVPLSSESRIVEVKRNIKGQ